MQPLKNFLLPVIVFYHCSLISSLMVILDQHQKFCIRKEVEISDTVQISYVVSGNEDVEKSVNVTLTESFKDPKDRFKGGVLYSNWKKEGTFAKEADISLEVRQNSTMTFCFLCEEFESTIVSFEFYTMNESGHILSLAKDEVFEEMYRNVTIIGYMFEEIEKNLKYFVERRDIHAKIITDVISTIEKVTTLKVIAILLISFIQILFIRKIFLNKQGVITNKRSNSGSISGLGSINSTNQNSEQNSEVEMNPFL